MIIDKSIKRITVENTEIQKIMHGGGILWQAKKYTIKWEDKNNIDLYMETNKTFYYTYNFKNGKIIGVDLVNSNPRNNLGKVIYHLRSDTEIYEIQPFELDEDAYHFYLIKIGRVVEDKK